MKKAILGRRAGSFPVWAASRLAGLVTHGIGLASTLATIVLFVVPSFASWLPRWLALIPVSGYVVYHLLRDEYDRVSGPCLDAAIDRVPGRRIDSYRLRVWNCGPVLIEQVMWELPEDTRWEVAIEQIEYPVSVLEPDDNIAVPLIVFMNSAAQARLILLGTVNGSPYRRERLLTIFSA